MDTGESVTHEVQMDSMNFSTRQRTGNVSWTDVGPRYKNWTEEQVFSLQTLIARGVRSAFEGTHVVVSVVHVLNPQKTSSNRLLCINDTLISNHTGSNELYWEPLQTSIKKIVSVVEDYTQNENYTFPYKGIELLRNATLNCTCTRPDGERLVKEKTLNCTNRNCTGKYISRPVTTFALGASCGTVTDASNVSLYEWKDGASGSQGVIIALVFVTATVLFLVVIIFVFRERLRTSINGYRNLIIRAVFPQ